MSTKAIEQFLQTAYSDEELAALLAHAEDGKLSFWSCCCLIGIVNAPHALKGRSLVSVATVSSHDNSARRDFAGASKAEEEFIALGSDAERRAKLIPIIRAEMERRERLTQDGRDTRDNSRSRELASVLIGD